VAYGRESLFKLVGAMLPIPERGLATEVFWSLEDSFLRGGTERWQRSYMKLKEIPTRSEGLHGGKITSCQIPEGSGLSFYLWALEGRTALPGGSRGRDPGGGGREKRNPKRKPPGGESWIRGEKQLEFEKGSSNPLKKKRTIFLKILGRRT